MHLKDMQYNSSRSGARTYYRYVWKLHLPMASDLSACQTVRPNTVKPPKKRSSWEWLKLFFWFRFEFNFPLLFTFHSLTSSLLTPSLPHSSLPHSISTHSPAVTCSLLLPTLSLYYPPHHSPTPSLTHLLTYSPVPHQQWVQFSISRCQL
jgi:hypothetical protein